MVEHRIGCMGWSYNEWKGPFYAPGTPPGQYLEAYARVFDLVEIDSSFYRPPPRSFVQRWAEATPEGFLFSVKVPKAITHEARCQNVYEPLADFFDLLDPLRQAGKLGPVVFQLPPSLEADAIASVKDAMNVAWHDDLVALEPRHASWWDKEVYHQLESLSKRRCLVWSLNQYTTTPPVMIGSDWLYIRLLGDRAIEPAGRIERDRQADIDEMAARVRGLAPEADLGTVYWFVNNHFMGYAPGTAERVADALGIPRPDLSAARRGAGQASLDDLA